VVEGQRETIRQTCSAPMSIVCVVKIVIIDARTWYEYHVMYSRGPYVHVAYCARHVVLGPRGPTAICSIFLTNVVVSSQSSVIERWCGRFRSIKPDAIPRARRGVPVDRPASRLACPARPLTSIHVVFYTLPRQVTRRSGLVDARSAVSE